MSKDISGISLNGKITGTFTLKSGVAKYIGEKAIDVEITNGETKEVRTMKNGDVIHLQKGGK